MAPTPATLTLSPRAQERIVEAALLGKGATAIARAAFPKHQKKRLALKRQIRRNLARNPEFQQQLADMARGNMILALPSISEALVQRAQAGRVDAIKLIFEATGFHNPRVDHNHSGDITLKLEMPRPARVADPTALEAGVVEGTVVED